MEATQRFCSGVEGLAAGSPRSASLRTVLMMLSEHRGVGTAGRWGVLGRTGRGSREGAGEKVGEGARAALLISTTRQHFS